MCSWLYIPFEYFNRWFKYDTIRMLLGKPSFSFLNHTEKPASKWGSRMPRKQNYTAMPFWSDHQPRNFPTSNSTTRSKEEYCSYIQFILIYYQWMKHIFLAPRSPSPIFVPHEISFLPLLKTARYDTSTHKLIELNEFFFGGRGTIPQRCDFKRVLEDMYLPSRRVQLEGSNFRAAMRHRFHTPYWIMAFMRINKSLLDGIQWMEFGDSQIIIWHKVIKT